jgi:hypothetical protein
VDNIIGLMVVAGSLNPISGRSPYYPLYTLYSEVSKNSAKLVINRNWLEYFNLA